MAKLSRVLQKVFGSSGGSSEFGEIGSLAAGAAVYSKDLDTIQSLTQYLSGLFAITNSGAEPPRIQDINALYLLITSQLKYIFQAGVPEYIATEEYYIGSICQVAGVLYTSLTGTNGSPNTGNDVSDTDNWKKTLDIGEISGMGTNWPAALVATLASNVAHVLTTGLGTDWQGLLEAAANTAVKSNIAASCSGNAATASNAALINGLSLAAGSAGTFGYRSMTAGEDWVIPAGLYVFSGGAGTSGWITLQIYTGSAWGPSISSLTDASFQGMILSDGTNFRLHNSSGTGTDLFYRKLV